MSEYRTRVMAVEAFRLPAEQDHDLAAFHAWAEAVGFTDFESDRRGTMAVRTDRGVAIARPGDWIAKGPSGAFAVLRPDEFDDLMEPAAPPEGGPTPTPTPGGGYAVEFRSDGQVVRYEGPTAEEVLRLVRLAEKPPAPGAT